MKTWASQSREAGKGVFASEIEADFAGFVEDVSIP